MQLAPLPESRLYLFLQTERCLIFIKRLRKAQLLIAGGCTFFIYTPNAPPANQLIANGVLTKHFYT